VTLNGQLGAIVMAAGLGTRMRSQHAKVLHRLAGTPLIRYPLAALHSLQARPLVVVVGHQAEAVMAACGGFDAHFAHQRQPRGTGHAVQCGVAELAGFAGDLLILPSDLPLLTAETLQRLVDARRSEQATVSLLTATVADPTGYGRIVRQGGRVIRVVEDRDADHEQRAMREINVGVYCVAGSFLHGALAKLQPDNAQHELYLTDIVGLAVAAGERVASASVDESEVTQISARRDLARVEQALRERITARWMDEGVTFDDPASTSVGPEVTFGRDTVIGPNIILRGRTQIGNDCRLDGSAMLVDCTVGSGVHIRFGVVATEAHIGDRCVVGPFAQLRPGTHLGAEVHIGDFVETKNAVIGARTKANHLAYIGDAEIGRDANIGAGTITCNYDGFRKHRTVIGDRVQVGSDSQLIAPVTVADDAYVATGTTVREDVPAGALVFTAKAQQIRRGWVAERRAHEAARSTPATLNPKAKPAAKRRSVAKLRRTGMKKRSR
jgi:bifunctional UDP-N-acetylglucosamine pyrophosphorylase/glucosamine-1-phosphate N-acetyltransferase